MRACPPKEVKTVLLRTRLLHEWGWFGTGAEDFDIDSFTANINKPEKLPEAVPVAEAGVSLDSAAHL